MAVENSLWTYKNPKGEICQLDAFVLNSNILRNGKITLEMSYFCYLYLLLHVITLISYFFNDGQAS